MFVCVRGKKMTDFEAQPILPQQRLMLARFGITLLNLLQPGLGLLRLSQGRLGLVFILLPYSAVAILFALYRVIQDMTFLRFMTIMALALTLLAIAYLGSFIATWRRSVTFTPSVKWWSRWYGLLIIVAIGIALMLPAEWITHYYKGFYTPAESMKPTLEIKDKFLGKMSNFGEIQRGDVMIVRAKIADYVKRAVAVPGDTIALKSGILIINGAAVVQNLIETKANADPLSASGQIRILDEKLPGEARAHRILDLGITQGDNWPETKLGPGEYFFLGDNRDNSADSRHGLEMMGLGVVSRERIIGRALFRYWRAGTGYKEGSI
jgi:signal peptidase I